MIFHNDSLPDGAIPLREAIRQFVADDLWREYERAVEVRKRLPKWRIVRPSYFLMSVQEWQGEQEKRHLARQTAAAQSDLDKAWRNIRRFLVEQFKAGEITAWAQKDPPFGSWLPIPAAAWRSLRIVNIKNGHIVGPNVDLTNIHVVRATAEPPPTKRGRPSSKSWILDEFRRRLASGEVGDVLRVEASNLARWLKRVHPDKPPEKPKSIEDIIRDEFNAAKKHTKARPRSTKDAKP